METQTITRSKSTSRLAGGVIAAYLGSNQLVPNIGVAAFFFELAFLETKFLFKQVEGWCLEYKPPAIDKYTVGANRFIDPSRSTLRRESLRASLRV
jgi:hypothetical protein